MGTRVAVLNSCAMETHSLAVHCTYLGCMYTSVVCAQRLFVLVCCAWVSIFACWTILVCVPLSDFAMSSAIIKFYCSDYAHSHPPTLSLSLSHSFSLPPSLSLSLSPSLSLSLSLQQTDSKLAVYDELLNTVRGNMSKLSRDYSRITIWDRNLKLLLEQVENIVVSAAHVLVNDTWQCINKL